MEVNPLNKYERILAVCKLVIAYLTPYEESRKQILNSKLYQKSLRMDDYYTQSRKQLLKCKLYQKLLADEREQDAIAFCMQSASRQRQNTTPTPYGTYHVALGRGNKVVIDDESQHDHAFVSLGLYTKNLPSNQYSH